MSLLSRVFRHAMMVSLAAVLLSGGAERLHLPSLGVTPAMAQDEEPPRRRTLLDLLFRGRSRPEPQIEEVPQQKRTTRVNRSAAGDTASAPAPAASAVVEKSDTARVILVVGDFTAGGLAQGLEDAYVQVPMIRIESRSNGSSGFVRDDYYNWPRSIGGILEEVKPALVIMMIGSNDRQAMRIDGKSEKVRSDAWNKEYNARIKAFADTVKAANVPLVWVGGPPFRFKTMSADILAFNEFYRTATEAAGGTFVDIWDGFVDQDGQFVISGSDINGQTVRLRNSDGINFTTDGKRKLAFYVERVIKQMFGDLASPQLAALAPESLSTMRLPPQSGEEEMVRFDPIPLADPEIDGGAALLGDPSVPQAAAADNSLLAKNPLDRLVEDGVPPPAKPGRINDFDWPAAGG